MPADVNSEFQLPLAKLLLQRQWARDACVEPDLYHYLAAFKNTALTLSAQLS